jgi:hypothetical protein
MKTSIKVFCLLLITSLVAFGCSIFGTGKSIKPSGVIISESRNMSGFTGIDMGIIGKVVISQGEPESVSITSSDNLIPLIKTSVRDGILYIETTEPIDVTALGRDVQLDITIVVKELSALTLSGLGEVQMGSLTTPKLNIVMSGGGKIKISRLTTDELSLTLSGAGTVELAGEAKQATIELSGAGDVKAADLKIQTASVTLPGLGGATLWVIDQLTGEISGAGSVSYYGSPETDVSSTGLGSFKSLGNK